MTFAEKYGPWALVAGASEGLGAAFAHDIAGRGIDVVLVARRHGKMEEVAASIRERTGRQVRCQATDLASPHVDDVLAEALIDVEIGLYVHNAAAHPIGPFLETTPEQLRLISAVNCTAPMLLSRHFGAGMVERGRGGIVIMGSLSGMQGCGLIAPYAASKSFDRVLAEGLWYELKGQGVDVIGCHAGGIRTPNYLDSNPRNEPMPPMEPEDVAREALDALGSGPNVIPGETNRMGAKMMAKMPREHAIEMVSQATAAMFGKS